MLRKLLALIAVFALVSTECFAASSIDALPATTFPLPDSGNPATSTDNAWISQNGTDYRATYQQLSAPFQGNVAPSSPFRYQMWWNTSTSPPQLEIYDGSQWLVSGLLDITNHAWTPIGTGGASGMLSSASNAQLPAALTNLTAMKWDASNALNGTTGTGAVVLRTSPSLTTPALGVAGATSVNKWIFTAPSTAATLAAGADNLTYTMPAISDTIVGRTTTDTLINKTIDTAGPNTVKVNGNALAATAGTATVTIPNSTDTLVGRLTTDTLNNKTIDTANSNNIKVNGNAFTASVGSALLTVPNSTDTLIGRATTDTLINKTVDTAGPNTIKVNGNLLSATAGVATVTVPNSTDTLVGKATTDTLINKTIDTAGPNTIKISGVTVSRGQFLGTSTNDNATAANVGEYITASVVQGSAVALTTATPANITSISLTAGDWDVRGTCGFHPAGTTTITAIQCGISSTTATMPTVGSTGSSQLQATFTTGTEQQLPVSETRISLAGTTTVFIVGQSGFGTSTMGVYGSIAARRAR